MINEPRFAPFETITLDLVIRLSGLIDERTVSVVP
jgi:hypothetical protein